VARGGYSGTLSWLALSPAVIRLLASRVLPTEAFAGFSFVQGLTVSLQRYAPSFILSPLIEPAATAGAVRTGRTGPMLRVLSLMVTADALVIGAAVLGASVAGAPLILALTHGRYGGAAVFLPWLLALIVVNASHRAVEAAAVAADAPEALSRSLGFSLAWLAAAGALTLSFGVWPLLLCPFGDAATRFWIVRQALAQRGSGGASKPLRVMVLTPRGLGGTGGVDRLMDGLRPWLAGRGDLQVRFVTTRGPRRWASPIYTIAAMARLTSARLLRRMDLIHVNLGAYGGCYRKMLLLAIPRLLRTPYVIHLHGSAFAPFWAAAPAPLRARIDRLFEDAAQVIVLGEDWRRRLEVRVPKAAGRIVVLPNAVAPIKGCRPADRAHVRILFLGELGPRKGAAILIQALAKLRTNPSWSAVIAGDGPVLEVRRLAASLGVADRVALPGWVGPDEVERLLAASDILILPSFEETLPMAVIEGFAAGLPVIATPVGALPDIITPGETGLFTPPGDVDALARAIDSLIANPDLRLRLGRAAKAYHAEYLSIGRYAERLEALWRASARRRNA
jgi:glycosyltransferase involved in cell wall biosynthesis